ncbi:hypothetical protein ES703_29251 [subsurface metagenome]
MKNYKIILSTIKHNLKILPPRTDLCQECATKHDINEPHNRDSLYYQIHFKMKNGRSPNWEDAIAHCDKVTKQLWRKELIKLGETLPEKANKKEVKRK